MPRWLLFTLLGLAAVVTLAILAGIGSLITWGVQTLSARPPAVGTTVVAPDESKAARALDDLTAGSAEYEATAYLAEVLSSEYAGQPITDGDSSGSGHSGGGS